MKKEELWSVYTTRNPKFGDPDGLVTIKASGLKKLFDQTWEKAQSQGFDNGLAFAKLHPQKSADPMDMFRDVFNPKK